MSRDRDASPTRKSAKKPSDVQKLDDTYDWAVISVMGEDDASYVLALPQTEHFEGFVDWLQNVWQKQDEPVFLPDIETNEWASGDRKDDPPDPRQFKVFDRLGYFDTPATKESFAWDAYVHMWPHYPPTPYTGHVLHIATTSFD